MINLDQYLLNGQIKDLAHLTQFDVMDIFDEKPSFFSVTGKINYNESTYQQYLKIYTDDFQKKLSSFECISCHRLFVKERVRELKNEELENEIIKKLSTNYEKDTYFICREQCYKQLFQLEKVPIYSSLNNTKLEFPPDELANLNLYEKLLIQKAKCFQTIIKLKTHRKFTGAQNAPALSGLAVHLPITFNETHQFLDDNVSVPELPSADALSIVIDGLPTKNGNIWRSLVNLDKVYIALNWLKLNNIHYFGTKINKNLSKSPSSLIFQDDVGDSNGNLFKKFKLKQKKIYKNTSIVKFNFKNL